MKRYAIVGFGCAGYHALSALRESDHEAEIHVFSDLDQPPANPMLTTYYAAGRLPYEALFPFGSLEDISRRFSPVLHSGVAVTGLDASARTLTWDGGQASFDAILLSTGADRWCLLWARPWATGSCVCALWPTPKRCGSGWIRATSAQ